MDAASPDTRPYVKPALKGTTACAARTATCVCGEHRREHRLGGSVGTTHVFEPRLCTKPAMPNGRCETHRGNATTGVAHWNYQGKGHSKVLPKRMLADYENARANPARLSLEDEIAELRAIRDDYWRAVEGHDALSVAEVRAAASSIFKALRASKVANKSGDAHKFAEAMNALDEAVDALSVALNPLEAMESAKRSVADMNVKVEKLLKTENSRVFEERGMISLEAALADRHTMVVAFLSQITKHVPDSETQKTIRRAVGHEYARLTGRRDDSAPDAGRGPTVLDVEHSVTPD